jgi:nitrogen fixation-related uncharacterized protein
MNQSCVSHMISMCHMITNYTIHYTQQRFPYIFVHTPIIVHRVGFGKQTVPGLTWHPKNKLYQDLHGTPKTNSTRTYMAPQKQTVPGLTWHPKNKQYQDLHGTPKTNSTRTYTAPQKQTVPGLTWHPKNKQYQDLQGTPKNRCRFIGY